MKKVFAILLVLIMAMTLVAACGNGGDPAPAPAPAQPAPPAGAPAAPAPAPAQPAPDATPIRIGAIASLSGALQDYGEQFQRGFLLGLEYMTNGTNMVAGRPLEIIWEDTTTVPDVARERTMVLLETHNVDIVTGFTASGDAIASLALFEEFETVAIIEPAAADAIIASPNWNEFIFRTGRTSGQDAMALASAIQRNAPPGARIATLAPDTTFGHSMVEPFIPVVEGMGFDFVQAEFAPADATDFSPFLLRLRETAPDYLYVIWAGANNPWMQMMELDLVGAGITIITGAPELAALYPMRPLGEIGGFGFCVYYPTLPQNEPMNDWLVARHMEVHGIPSDIFTSGGMAAASAIVTALELTGGVTDPSVLIPTLRGMEFPSPTGMRWFRYEDHQAMQALFEVEFTVEPGVEHMVPRWVRTIPAEELMPPILNGR